MQDIRIKTAELYARYADILYRTAYAKLLSIGFNRILPILFYIAVSLTHFIRN